MLQESAGHQVWEYVCVLEHGVDGVKRESVEKMFDTYKTVLDADKLYLQSDESIFPKKQS